jgi:hypothetical protein
MAAAVGSVDDHPQTKFFHHFGYAAATATIQHLMLSSK